MKKIILLSILLIRSTAWSNNMCPEFNFTNLNCTEKRETLQGVESESEFEMEKISSTELSNGRFEFVQKRSDQPEIIANIPGVVKFKKYNRIYNCPLGLINYADTFRGAQISRAIKILENKTGIEVFGYAFANDGHEPEDIIKINRVCKKSNRPSSSNVF